MNWARLSNTTFDVTLWLYLGAMVLSFAYLAARREVFWVLARVVAIAGVTTNLVSIVARGIAADRVPWGNMFEYSTVLAFLVVLGTLVFVEGVARIKTLTGFSLMFAVLTLAIAAIFFPVEPSPLQPALNSYWIKIHVVAAITGSSLFAIGGIATILFLIKDRSERRALASLRERTPAPIMGGATTEVDAPPRPPARSRGIRRAHARARARRHPAVRRRAGPRGVPGDRVRVPDLDLRRDRRRDLGPGRVGPLLGMGPEGDVVVRDVDDLRRLSARAIDGRMEGTPCGGDRRRRVRLAVDHVLRREPVDRRTALLRERMRRPAAPDPGDTVRAGSPSPSSEELRETEGTVRKRLLWATAGIGLLLLLSACAPNATQDTLQPQGPFAQKLKDLFIPVFWVAVFVFIVVEGGIVWITIRFRHRKGRERMPDADPRQHPARDRLDDRSRADPGRCDGADRRVDLGSRAEATRRCDQRHCRGLPVVVGLRVHRRGHAAATSGTARRSGRRTCW